MVTGTVRVFIATTEGPSEVQRIVPEDVDVRSVVCLDGTSEALPISRDYDAFVRKPTGVIERVFGHPSFRVDVSHRISHGRSWQLGLLAAHALHAAGRLASPGMDADAALWVTGEVRHDLAVAGVERCRDKVRQSEALLTELARAGVPTTLLVPEENQTEVEDEADRLGFSQDAITIRGIRDWASADLAEDAPAPAPRRSRFRLVLAATVTLMVATGAYAAWTIHSVWNRMPSLTAMLPPQRPVAAEPAGQPNDVRQELKPGAETAASIPVPARGEQDAAQPPAPKPRVSSVAPESKVTVGTFELRAPVGAGCGSLRLTGVAPEAVEIIAGESADTVPHGSAQGLCGLEFQIGNERSEAEQAWIYLHSDMEGASDVTERRILRPGEPVTMKISSNPWKPPSSWRATLIVATSRQPVELPEEFPSGSSDEVEARLLAKGLNITTARYMANAPEAPRFQ